MSMNTASESASLASRATCIPLAEAPRIARLVEQAVPPAPLTAEERERLRTHIRDLLFARDAVLVAHYYVDAELQRLAEETGGCVADSLQMAAFGRDHPARTLVVCGVRFMGETAKILSPDKRVLMPTLKAECSLDLSCPAAEFAAFRAEHPERTVVVYANTSAAVKAEADWMVTSSNAVAIVRHLHERGEKILWAPDRHLGRYVAEQTGADLLSWQGDCVVHNAFRADALEALLRAHPEAAVLAHPESPAEVLALAQEIGSTSQLIAAARRRPEPMLIVATERGIFYKMQQAAPEKTLIAAPSRSDCGTACATCPWMGLNGLAGVAEALERLTPEITVPEAVRVRALGCIERMLGFSQQAGLVPGRPS